MLYILAAISVHNAIDTSSPEQQSKYMNKIYAILGVMVNPYAKIGEKLLQNLLAQDPKHKTEYVVWHDVSITIICRHKSKFCRP